MVNLFEVLLIIIIVVLGWVIWKIYKLSEADKKDLGLLEKEKDEYEELGKGLAEYNQKLQEKKNKTKENILGLFEGQSGRVCNKDVAQKLEMSSVQAFRYLNELESEGKVKQVGKTGRSVFYSLK